MYRKLCHWKDGPSIFSIDGGGAVNELIYADDVSVD